jgi:hypothetical protein
MLFVTFCMKPLTWYTCIGFTSGGKSGILQEINKLNAQFVGKDNVRRTRDHQALTRHGFQDTF